MTGETFAKQVWNEYNAYSCSIFKWTGSDIMSDQSTEGIQTVLDKLVAAIVKGKETVTVQSTCQSKFGVTGDQTNYFATEVEITSEDFFDVADIVDRSKKFHEMRNPSNVSVKPTIPKGMDDSYVPIIEGVKIFTDFLKMADRNVVDIGTKNSSLKLSPAASTCLYNMGYGLTHLLPDNRLMSKSGWSNGGKSSDRRGFTATESVNVFSSGYHFGMQTPRYGLDLYIRIEYGSVLLLVFPSAAQKQVSYKYNTWKHKTPISDE